MRDPSFVVSLQFTLRSSHLNALLKTSCLVKRKELRYCGGYRTGCGERGFGPKAENVKGGRFKRKIVFDLKFSSETSINCSPHLTKYMKH